MSKKTKTLTTKQAAIRAAKLLKGIDNSVAQILKHQSAIDGSLPELKTLLGGLSNPPVAAPKPAPKPAAKPVKKPAAKPAKAAPKPAKPAKAAPKPAAKKAAPKPAAKPKDKKSNGRAQIKDAVVGRPSLKQAIQAVLSAKGPSSAAEIYKEATDAYGYWSRQSLYTALKDEKVFTRVDDKFQLVGQNSGGSSDKVEDFVSQVATDADTAKVV